MGREKFLGSLEDDMVATIKCVEMEGNGEMEEEGVKGKRKKEKLKKRALEIDLLYRRTSAVFVVDRGFVCSFASPTA